MLFAAVTFLLNFIIESIRFSGGFGCPSCMDKLGGWQTAAQLLNIFGLMYCST